MKLYGKNPVIERLKSDPKSIARILIQEQHPDGAYVRQKCKQWGIPISTVPASRIQKLAQNLNTQGILAEVASFPYVDYADLLQRVVEKRQVVLFLDHLTDPQNLGAIIRTAGSLGDMHIVLPSTESVGVTETVLRIACGGENYIAISRVSNLANAIDKAKDQGVMMIGTAVKDAPAVSTVTMQFPLGIVVGSEHKGVRDIIRKRLDHEVMIPMKNQRMSLNVANATAMMCYEAQRQRLNK